MSDRPNSPVPDELFAVRAELARLKAREVELRELLIAHPDIRTGADYVAEVKTLKVRQPDIREMRAMYPEQVEEHTHEVTQIRVELLGISEDGELVRPRKLRSAAQ